MADLNEIFKDRRVVIGSAVAALVVIGGGIAAYTTMNGGGGGAAAPAPAAPAAPAPGAPGAPGAPPAAPGAPATAVATPGAPAAAPGAPVKVASAAKGPIRQTTTSFDDAPASYGGGAAGGAAAPAGGGPGGPGAPGAAGAAGGAAAAGPLDKLPPIQRGIKPQDRSDPFVSYRLPKFAQTPAYAIAIPMRIASRPKIEVPEMKGISPEERLGPLPPVERRVAGVLYDGSVSAILEIGTPGGSNTAVQIVSPGQTVPSGIPNVEDLTVSSITPTGVVLRAVDGRSVNVKLSNVPAAYADAFHQAASATVGGMPGGYPGGPGGPPPGFVPPPDK